MEDLKSLFGEETLSYEQFTEKVSNANIKLANINAGGYVEKAKLDKQITSNKELQAKYDELVKNTENYEAITQELNSLREEKTNNELAKQIHNANVDDKFAKFVLSEVRSIMKEGDKFEDVLSKYVKDNPQYLTQRQGAFRFFGSSTPNLEQGNQANTKSENETMNDIFRNFRRN